MTTKTMDAALEASMATQYMATRPSVTITPRITKRYVMFDDAALLNTLSFRTSRRLGEAKVTLRDDRELVTYLKKKLGKIHDAKTEAITIFDETDSDGMTLLCLGDGTILADTDQPNPDRHERYRCRSTWPIWGVLHE